MDFMTPKTKIAGQQHGTKKIHLLGRHTGFEPVATGATICHPLQINQQLTLVSYL